MKNLKVVLIILTAMLLLTSCSLINSKAIDFGTIENNTYSNKYFNMTMEMPEDWILQFDKLNRNSTKKNDIDLSEEKKLTLIAAFKYPVMGQPGFNPSFICMVDKITTGFKAKKGYEYLQAVKDSLIAAQLPYEFSKEIYDEKIGSKNFSVLEGSITSGEFHVSQKSYAAIVDKYALVFTFTYSSDEEYDELNNIIKSIKFE